MRNVDTPFGPIPVPAPYDEAVQDAVDWAQANPDSVLAGALVGGLAMLGWMLINLARHDRQAFWFALWMVAAFGLIWTTAEFRLGLPGLLGVAALGVAALVAATRS